MVQSISTNVTHNIEQYWLQSIPQTVQGLVGCRAILKWKSHFGGFKSYYKISVKN